MDLLTALINLFHALVSLVGALALAILPWAPLLLFIAFWLLAVNWRKLYPILFLRGGIIGVFLLYVMIILAWGVVAPPEQGTHSMLGLTVSNFVGKMIYVTFLFVIAGLCGTVQLSGAFNRYLPFVEVEEPSPYRGSGARL